MYYSFLIFLMMLNLQVENVEVSIFCIFLLWKCLMKKNTFELLAKNFLNDSSMDREIACK